MKKIESFTLDHTIVTAPYIRVAADKTLLKGSRLIKYDVRFTQPNESFLENDTLHSIEHCLATTLRDVTSYVIDISPMGCQTGFYVSVDGDGLGSVEEFIDILLESMRKVSDLTEVPGASVKECGFAASHNLGKAKEALTDFLQTAPSELVDVFRSK